MATTFVWSDQHFFHEKTCTVFRRDNGEPLRPFANADEMNEVMVDNYNSVVKPCDKVYFLGDVCFKKNNLEIINRLCGRKVLIPGNHDIFGASEYLNYFDEVHGMRALEGMILTHIPIHPTSVKRWGVNVHGHLHANEVLQDDGRPDPRYINVSVEQINFTPISLEDLRVKIAKRGELYA